jgi:hypothetical protein
VAKVLAPEPWLTPEQVAAALDAADGSRSLRPAGAGASVRSPG